MSIFPGVRRDPARPVRPSFRDPRFALLLAGQSFGWICSWASAIVLWGFAAYHFGASPKAISVTALCWSGPPVVLTAFTGGLTDRFGPRTMLIIGYACSAATSLGMTTAGSLMSLDIMAAACGAARSVCTPASSTPAGASRGARRPARRKLAPRRHRLDRAGGGTAGGQRADGGRGVPHGVRR